MNHQLTLTTTDAPAMLERLLRVVRHRGFAIKALNMTPAATSQQMQIELTVASERPISSLQSQLNKLYDVTHLELVTENEDALAISA